MITNAKNCVDLGRKETLRKKDRWFEILDNMQCTPKQEKSEEETSETERSRISEEIKNEARRKSQS